MIPNNIPSNAVRVAYFYGRHKGTMQVWMNNNAKHTWGWYALANSGEEDTKEKAIEAARFWIISHKIN